MATEPRRRGWWGCLVLALLAAMLVAVLALLATCQGSAPQEGAAPTMPLPEPEPDLAPAPPPAPSPSPAPPTAPAPAPPRPDEPPEKSEKFIFVPSR